MTSQYARQIAGLVDQFMAGVLEAVQDEIASALCDRPAAAQLRRRRSPARAPRTAHRPMPTQATIIEVAANARRYVEAHPGSSAHEIAVALGVTADDVRAPLRCLVDGGVLVTGRSGSLMRFSLRPDLASRAPSAAPDGQTVNIEAVAAQVRRYVEAHPRARRSEIARALGASSHDVARALTWLVRGGILLREGEARGSRYVSRYARTWEEP